MTPEVRDSVLTVCGVAGVVAVLIAVDFVRWMWQTRERK